MGTGFLQPGHESISQQLTASGFGLITGQPDVLLADGGLLK